MSFHFSISWRSGGFQTSTVTTQITSTSFRKWRAIRSVVSFLLGFILISQAAFAVPMTTSYQGVLRDKQGRLLNGMQVMTFSIYATAQGGTSLWTETHNIIAASGNVSVQLGSKTPLSPSLLKDGRFLGVKINANVEMTPRIALNSVLFALRAGIADSVLDGIITAGSLAPLAVTSEKVADGAVVAQKLAVNSVTTDKIANGAVTSEKLSAEVQQKLAQTGTGSLPASVATLNVTDKLKVGKNSINLGTTAPGLENSIATSAGSGTLLVQSEIGNNQNTVINAGNTGKVGIGMGDPSTKLDVNGAVNLAPIYPSTELDWRKFSAGLLMFYNSGTETGEIHSLHLGQGGYKDISLNGKNIFLNEKQSDGNLTTGNVGIGLPSGIEPKNQLDVGGSVAIGSNYAGKQTAPENGLLVEGSVGIGTTDPSGAKLEIQAISSALRASTEDGAWSYNAMFHVMGDDVKAIAVLRGRAHEVSYDKFVVMGSGDVYARSYKLQSDETLKEDVEPIKSSLEKVLKLRGVTFRFKNDSDKSGHKEMGVIAQEIEKVVPEVVSTSGETGLKSVSYQNLVALLIESTKEQQSQIGQLKAQNDALKTIVCKDHPGEAMCR